VKLKPHSSAQVGSNPKNYFHYTLNKETKTMNATQILKNSAPFQLGDFYGCQFKDWTADRWDNLQTWTISESTSPIAKATKAAIAELTSDESMQWYQDQFWTGLAAFCHYSIRATAWLYAKAKVRMERAQAQPVLVAGADDGYGDRPGAFYAIEQQSSAWASWKAYLMRLFRVSAWNTMRFGV
jgi:hypothetical protein